MTTKLLLTLVLTAVCASAISWYLPLVRSGPSSLQGDGVPPAPSASTSSPWDDWISATGRVEPCSGLRRLVFKTEGVVGQCRVQAGSQVKKGDVLLVLDNHEQEAAVALAQAELQQAEADRTKMLSGAHPEEIAAAQSRVQILKEQVRYFRTEFERNRKSFAGAAVSQQEYAQSWTSWVQRAVGQMNAEAELRRLQQQVRPEDRQVADARVGRAQAQLKAARQRLEDTFLKAPCDGTVLEVLKREGEGQRLLDGEPVVLFADLERLCIRADVEPQHAARLAIGQEVLVNGRGLAGKSVGGQVAAVKQVLGPKSLSGRAAERRDLEVLQVLVEVNSSFRAPVGLPVEIKIRAGS